MLRKATLKTNSYATLCAKRFSGGKKKQRNVLSNMIVEDGTEQEVFGVIELIKNIVFYTCINIDQWQIQGSAIRLHLLESSVNPVLV